MHEMELYPMPGTVAGKSVKNYSAKPLHMPHVRIAAKAGLALLLKLGYFSGLFLLLGTAGSIEQDVMTDKQVIGWAAAGIVLMVAAVVGNWLVERSEDEWQD